MANSRLQKVRERLKLELAEQSEPVYANKETPKVSASKNIFRDLDKWTNPIHTGLKKNLANTRLQNLKKYVTSNNTTVPDTKDNLKEICHRSPLLTGVKRNISNEIDPECIPAKRRTLDMVSRSLNSTQCSPSLETKDEISTRVDNEVIQTRISCNNEPPHSASKISERLNLSRNRKRTLSSADCELNKPSKSPLSPQNDVNSKTANTKDVNQNAATNTSPKFKTSASPTIEYSSFTPEQLAAGNSYRFMERMKRTASWVWSNLSNTESASSVEEQKPTTNLNTNAENNESESECFLDDTEEMEWTNAEPDEEVIDPVKDKLVKTEKKSPPKKNPEKLKDLCIVVDTNIFISGLSKLIDIISMTTKGPTPILYIPWMVITELDFMKDSCTEEKLKNNIMKSIKFINKALEENNPKLIGQTVYDMEKQKSIGPSQDDKIISCCLQVAEKYDIVILLSNDLNLKNKALINRIEACSAHEIIMKIATKMVKNSKILKIQQKMSILCSSIICECAKEVYGNTWSKMDMLSCPPWSLADCLRRFRKYWRSVFKDKVMKQFPNTLSQLSELLKQNKCMADDSEEYCKFVKLCINMCIFLKDIEECRGSVEKILNDIVRIS